MHAFRAPSFAGEQRWTLEMVAAVEVVATHLRLAAAGPPLAAAMPDPAVVPSLACNIFL